MHADDRIFRPQTSTLKYLKQQLHKYTNTPTQTPVRPWSFSQPEVITLPPVFSSSEPLPYYDLGGSLDGILVGYSKSEHTSPLTFYLVSPTAERAGFRQHPAA